MAASYKTLTPRQTLFVQEYLLDLNAAAAARRANLSEKSATTMMRLPSVKTAIEAAKSRRSAATKIDAEFVLLKLQEVLERVMQEVVPATDRRGRPLKDEDDNVLYRFDAGNSLRALDLIGRHIAVQAFEETVNVNVSSIIERLQAGRNRAAIRNRQHAIDVTPAYQIPAPRKGN